MTARRAPGLRRGHRIAGSALAAPLLLWALTGAAFHLKPGWNAAYEGLSIARPAPVDVTVVRAPSGVAAVLGGLPATRFELVSTALGDLYRVASPDASALVDARSAEVLSPLSIDRARTLLLDAVARSSHPERYGAIHTIAPEGRTVRATFEGGAEVVLDRFDARVTQRGPDTDRIDLLYRLHYGQWTGVEALDRVLPIALLASLVALTVLGSALWLLPSPRRGPGRPSS